MRLQTLTFLALGAALAGCADSPAGNVHVSGVDAGSGEDGPCVEGAGTCSNGAYSICQGGVFVSAAVCGDTQTCVPGQGCLDCAPGSAGVCDGNTLYACTAQGLKGDKVRDCEGGCVEGQCATDCAQGSELIYVVDDAYTLLSFDPRTNTFAEVGALRCRAGDSWPVFNNGAPATPFSMAVDRQARAWVLYSSGEIFWVDTQTGTCSRSPYTPGSDGFELFGMAFVSDGPGTGGETLFIAGGDAAYDRGLRLGSVDPDGGGAARIGGLAAHDFGAELTGNGNGELWAYWPGLQSSIDQLDKSTGQALHTYNVPPLFSQPQAWAFAHWGGRYFIFISVDDGNGGFASQVQRFDPATGRTDVAVQETHHAIVGAGVSTCAPVTSNF